MNEITEQLIGAFHEAIDDWNENHHMNDPWVNLAYPTGRSIQSWDSACDLKIDECTHISFCIEDACLIVGSDLSHDEIDNLVMACFTGDMDIKVFRSVLIEKARNITIQTLDH